MNLTAHSVGIGHLKACCDCPVSCGAGYRVFSSPVSQVKTWTTIAREGICHSDYRVGYSSGSAVSPTSPTALVRGNDAVSQFRETLRTLMFASRGLPLQSSAAGASRPFVQSGACKTVHATLRVSAGGDFLWQRSSGSCCSTVTTETGGFLQDLSFVAYQLPPACERDCCCEQGKFTLGLLSGEIFSLNLPADEAREAYDAVIAATATRSRSESSITIKDYGALLLSPGFVTLKMGSHNIVTFPASSVERVEAVLPPWQEIPCCAWCCRETAVRLQGRALPSLANTRRVLFDPVDEPTNLVFEITQNIAAAVLTSPGFLPPLPGTPEGVAAHSLAAALGTAMRTTTIGRDAGPVTILANPSQVTMTVATTSGSTTSRGEIVPPTAAALQDVSSVRGSEQQPLLWH